MAPHSTDQKWYSIAEEASKEMDSAKLTILVAQLCSALDDYRKPPASVAALKSQSLANPVFVQSELGCPPNTAVILSTQIQI